MEISKLELRQASFVCTAACLAGAATLLAQERPTLLEGRVLDSAFSEPLSNVEVMLFELSGNGEMWATRTDADGNYRFSDVDPGTYKLTAVKNGWAHQEYSHTKRSRRAAKLDIEPDSQLTDLNFRLERAAVVLGRVSDQEAGALTAAQWEMAGVMLDAPEFVDRMDEVSR